jgi:hypothetical protein
VLSSHYVNSENFNIEVIAHSNNPTGDAGLLEILKMLYEIISGKLCNIKILVYHIISHGGCCRSHTCPHTQVADVAQVPRATPPPRALPDLPAYDLH